MSSSFGQSGIGAQAYDLELRPSRGGHRKSTTWQSVAQQAPICLGYGYFTLPPYAIFLIRHQSQDL